jgi:hypothetical protein
MKRHFGVVLVGLLVTIGGVGCGGNELPDNARLLAAFEEGRTGVWVSGHGTIAQVLADETTTIGFPRQRFNVRVEDQLTVLVQHSLTEAGRVPAERGDVIAFQGRYEFNASGGSISHTHRDTSQPGSGGWIRHDGQVYQ